MRDELTIRQLNRATLARQLLLERWTMPAIGAIRHLVGLQAQAPFPPYYGLWARLDGFTADELSTALVDRSVVRAVLMRGTVHLVAAEDCIGLRNLMQPIMDRDLRTNTVHARQLAGVDLARVAALATGVLDGIALSPKELGDRLAEHFPNVAPASLAHAARDLVPLVQVPPRALWGRSGSPRSTTAASWLGGATTSAITPERLVERYLAAFGPASVNDLQIWCGLTRLREVVEAMRGLRRFVDDRGAELFDLDDAPRPDAEVPAPVRLVADFDNLVLSFADRRRVMSDAHRARLFDVKNGVIPGPLLVDGFVVGTWSITGRRSGSTVDVRPYGVLSGTATAEAVAEGERLLRLTGFAAPHEVRVHAPTE